MNFKSMTACAGIVVLLAGCATDTNGVRLDTVGPAPTQAANPGDSNGTLMVYSAYQANADFNNRDPYRREYTDYKIFRPNRTLEREVHNTSGSILQRPQQVSLPAGKYLVAAQANAYGEITVPVVILAGRDTIVHLEGGFSWPNRHALNQTNSVRLPDGEVVGWKSTADWSQ